MQTTLYRARWLITVIQPLSATGPGIRSRSSIHLNLDQLRTTHGIDFQWVASLIYLVDLRSLPLFSWSQRVHTRLATVHPLTFLGRVVDGELHMSSFLTVVLMTSQAR